MANKIMYITKEEALIIKRNVLKNQKVFLAELEGAEIESEEDYVRVVSCVFQFPSELPEMKIGWCNDYINDLMWIEQQEIVMLIHNYKMMFINNQKIKEHIIADFKEIILPWWDGEVIGHMVGAKPRKFNIYLEI